MTTTHFDFLDGAVNDLIPFAVVGQKTSKTRCGKRVAVSTIDNVAPTCSACRASKVQEARSSLAAFMSILGDDTYASSLDATARNQIASAITHCHNTIARFAN